MTTKEKFLNDIKSLIETKETSNNLKGLAVWIETPDMPGRELIINPFENLQAKYDYYSKAYNDDLQLRTNPSIFISAYDCNGKMQVIVE